MFTNKAPRWFQILSQYGLSIVIVSLTTFLLWLLQGVLSIQVDILVYLLPVVITTRLWGFGPGILSAFFSFLSLNYFFIPPLHTFAVHQSQDLVGLAVFLMVSLVISELLVEAQTSLSVVKAREREATYLYEISAALVGRLDEPSIADILAQQILTNFKAEYIEIEIFKHVCADHCCYKYPANGERLPTSPTLIANLGTARRDLGKVSIWRTSAPFSLSDERLIKTFINQGALAIERAELSEAENRAKVLEQSDQLNTALLSSVSHELRTPLATIKAGISGLRSGLITWDSDARQDLLLAVEEETDHLNLLVGNLLDMSRIETGALKLQRKWNSLIEIVNGVQKRMDLLLQNHQVILKIPADLPLIPVDYVLIEQVFTNLFSNGIKYAPPQTRILVTAALQPDQTILVQVSNEGPPVDEVHLNRIFDKFYRVTEADKTIGVGLGLSICKGIIEAHGGRIWAENIPGGFAFNFYLPVTWEGAQPHLPQEE